MGARPRHRRSRLGSILVAIGLLGLIGGSFALGVVVGRHWSYFATLTTRAKASAEGQREAGEARGFDKMRRPSETIPTLTFYQELTAPLASPPAQASAPSPVRSSAPPPARSSALPPVQSSTLSPALPLAEAPARPSAVSSSDITEIGGRAGAFTVQLAAYKARSQAEALRETLAARGIDAYVTETVTPSGARYRVRVGSFERKEAARQKAVSLAADTRLGAFVTIDAAAP